MKKLLLLCLIGLLLSSCSLVRPHKNAIPQGNTITTADVSRLHNGMSTQQVRAIMGSPMLVNIFTPSRLDYIYTLQNPYEPRIQNQVVCLFVNGRLTLVRRGS